VVVGEVVGAEQLVEAAADRIEGIDVRSGVELRIIAAGQPGERSRPLRIEPQFLAPLVGMVRLGDRSGSKVENGKSAAGPKKLPI